jgi:hypothetical protein
MQTLIDRWAQPAMERPWRYAATRAISIGAANLGLRMLLNDLSLARNTRLAALTALGFFLFAWLYTAQLTRPLRRREPATHPAVPTTGAAPVWRCRPSRRHPTGRGPRSGRRFKEVAVRSPSAVGIDGHQWNVQCAPGARLPCRAMCECGWTSTAGQRTQVLLELKGHLEEILKNGKEGIMTTSDELRERALALAQAGVPTDDAVAELLARCADHRVPLVRARQTLADQSAAAPQGEVVARAVALLEETLRRGSWDVT